MTGIVHDERTLLLLLLDDIGYVGIAVTRRGHLLSIGIPHHFLHLVAGVGGHHLLGCNITVAHVEVAVAVVAHKHHHVLPGAGIVVIHIADGLVHHNLRVGRCRYGEAADAQVKHVGLAVVAILQVDALAIVEIAEEAVIDVAVHLIEGVLALVAEQVVVGVEVAVAAGEHAVIPHAVAEEQQIARQVGIGLCPVVKHLHIAAIGVGVGCAARELVVQFVGRHNVDAQRVVLTVVSRQALGLSKQFL